MGDFATELVADGDSDGDMLGLFMEEMINNEQIIAVTPVKKKPSAWMWVALVFFVTTIVFAFLYFRKQSVITMKNNISEDIVPIPTEKIVTDYRGNYINEEFGISFQVPNEWEETIKTKDKIPEGLFTDLIYKKSKTQTYPDERFPLDATLSIKKINNSENLTIDQLFEKEYEKCEQSQDNDSGFGTRGCPKYSTLGWKAYTIDGIEGLRGIISEEPLSSDVIYFKFDKYYLMISIKQWNPVLKDELEDSFEKIIQSIKFTNK